MDWIKEAIKILGWYLLYAWILVSGGLLITISFNWELPIFAYLSIMVVLIVTIVYFYFRQVAKKVELR